MDPSGGRLFSGSATCQTVVPRVEHARRSLRAGKGVPLEEV